MKKKITILLTFVLYLNIVSGQTSKSFDQLRKGIELNDMTKIEKALSQGVSIDKCLKEAVKQNKIEYVKYFIEKGADPGIVIDFAVKNNQTDIAKYLLEKGAQFNDMYFDDILGQVYLINTKLKDTIPVALKNGEVVQKINDSSELKTFVDVIFNSKANLLMYKTNVHKGRNSSLIFAIGNNNLPMVELLLEHGFNVTDSCVVREFGGISSTSSFADFMNIGSSNTKIVNWYVFTDIVPTPAVYMKPIEYAVSENVDKEIFNALLQKDSTSQFVFGNTNVKCTCNNPKITDLVINSFGYGFTLKGNIKNDDVFGLRLYFSFDNVDFKEIREITFPRDTSRNKAHISMDITEYFNNFLSGGESLNDIYIKIELKEYGKFIDSRDGEIYRTVEIGDFVVMAENLRYKTTEGCWENGKGPEARKEYGYLYTFGSAKTVAPPGWHVPEIDEWVKLFRFLGGYSDFYGAMKKLQKGGSTGFNLTQAGTKSILGITERGYGDFFWSSSPTCLFMLFSEYNGINVPSAAQKNCVRDDTKVGCSVRLFKNK